MGNLFVLSSSAIDKKLENFESICESFVNFEFIFEFFVISSFLSMVDEVTTLQKI